MSVHLLASVSVHLLNGSSTQGRSAAFLVLLGFLLSFMFIRTSARMIRAQVSWWPGNVETGSGLHLHHLVWGITLMLISGFAGFAFTSPVAPWYQIAAVVFGVGAGLTFDEFALWIHLSDVYWTEEGRSSLDAVVLVIVFMALVVLGSKPFGLEGNESIGVGAIVVAQALVLSVITLLKGRIALGVASVFIPFLGLWGALRLGRPGSPWARRRYSPEKLARANSRYPPDSRGPGIRDGFFNAIGGRTDQQAPPQPPEH